MIKIKKVILVILSLNLLVCSIPISSSAAATIPVITSPTQYKEVPPLTALTISWSAPSSGTVSYYSVSVRELVASGEPTNTLILSGYVTTSRSVTLEASKIKRSGTYRISVSAVMTDGTTRWSEERYFHSSVSKRIKDGKTISFKIYTGFAPETKNAIYYSTRTWINALGLERVNTYAYDQGTDLLDYEAGDGENVIVPVYYNNSNHLMSTISAVNSDNFTVEADIMVNKYYPWSNDLSANTYDIQNVMTHEIGHVYCLTDKYESYAMEWTMFGTSEYRETKKRSLASYDIAAINNLSYDIYS